MNLDWVKTVAPTVATVLGGPLAGLAVEAVGTAFGWTDATKEKVESVLTSGQLSGDQLLQLKQAELALQAKEQELGFRFAELDIRDRESARNREAQVKDNTNKILAYTVVGAFVALVAGTMLGWARVDSALAGTLVGYLSAKAEQVLAYYFGSTKGSADKTAMLARAGERK
jgi:hypothetical protein